MINDNHIKNETINVETNPSNLEDDIEKEEKTFEERTDPEKKPKSLYLESLEKSKFEFQISKTLVPPKEMKENNSYGYDVDCFCLRWEKNDPVIAAGFSNGYIALFNTETGSCSKYIKVSEYPVTSLRWKPYIGTKPKNILTSVTADGKIDFWHSSSGKILYSLVEEGNPIMCMDFNSDGTLFATAGNDKVVKLYDDNMKTLISTMKSNSFSQPGHSNRIFSVIFNKESDNMLISGGWDNTLQIYDVRQRSIVSSIYGPHICGDAIDIRGNKILTASWSAENQIQIFDLRMLKEEKVLDMAKIEGGKKKGSFLYTCQFAKFRNESYMFSVGGSSENTFATLDYDKYKNKDEEPVINFNMYSQNLTKSCYALDYSYKSREFAVGTGEGAIHIVSYQEK